MDYPVILFIDD